jgi:hypothetical protein
VPERLVAAELDHRALTVGASTAIIARQASLHRRLSGQIGCDRTAALPVAIRGYRHQQQARQMIQISTAQNNPEMRTPVTIPLTGASSLSGGSADSNNDALLPRNNGIRAGLTLPLRSGLRRSATRGLEASTTALGLCESDMPKHLRDGCCVR